MYQIIPIPALKDNYIWLMINNQNKNCLVVDPGEAEPVLQKLKSLQISLAAILVTHHHADHSAGIGELLNFKKVPVYSSDPARILHTTHPIYEKTFSIEALDVLFNVFSLPGHTLTHAAFHADGFVFTGDTLFTGGCGRLFEGTPEAMLDSLDKLKALPDETLIYCGHEYTAKNLEFAKFLLPENEAILARLETTLKMLAAHEPTVPAPLYLEKLTNPFLLCHSPEVIKAAEKIAKRALKSRTEVFAVIRKAKDNF